MSLRTVAHRTQTWDQFEQIQKETNWMNWLGLDTTQFGSLQLFFKRYFLANRYYPYYWLYKNSRWRQMRSFYVGFLSYFSSYPVLTITLRGTNIDLNKCLFPTKMWFGNLGVYYYNWGERLYFTKAGSFSCKPVFNRLHWVNWFDIVDEKIPRVL